MANELEEFHYNLFQEVGQKADGEGKLRQESFFEIYTQELIEAGDITEAQYSHYERRGIRIDGYGADPRDVRDSTLSVLVNDFDESPDNINTLTRSELNTSFKRLSQFVTRSLDPDFRDSLEETDPAFGLTDLIATRWNSISRVRMFILTNKVLSSRVDRIDAGQIYTVPVVHSVWDLSRMLRNRTAGEVREEMNIDLVNDFGGAISALRAHLENDQYESYLAVIPAKQLAAIYEKWSDRLLEYNVRVFLQARSDVNRKMRNTLQNEPDMFFAYNNGITATAQEVEIHEEDYGIEIVSMKNFQIVNGGQTTGSIYTASKNKNLDLSRVFVQMKLSVIADPARIDEMVPQISKYANSQNKVNASDFYSNHPFHVRIEEFSRRIYAPSQDGTFNDSKWFYERARGQYQDSRGNRTDSQRKAFDIEFPPRQRFVKTDLAKFLNVWENKPDVVSKGAQENFKDFAENLGKAWERDSNQFNEMYYKEAIAKVIIFRETEKLVSSQPWYQVGGYRASIVAYSIAKLAYDLSQSGMNLNFESIWKIQALTPELSSVLAVGAAHVKEVIHNPGGMGYQNITQWAKQPACWSRVQGLSVDWPESLNSCLLTADEQKDNKLAAKKDQKVLNGIAAQRAVLNAEPAFWENMRVWGSGKGLLSEKDLSILNMASSISTTGKMPSDSQCDILIQAYSRLKEEGFPHDIESLED